MSLSTTGIDTLAARIYAISHLTGKFELRSGQISDQYFDKYRFEAEPGLLAEIARQMVALIPADTELLAGLEMGGIPVVTMLSHFSGLPCVFVRKSAKSYGTAKLAEGPDIAGKNLTVVEDVVTSGGQIVLSTADLRSRGAKVSTAICVIDRQSGGTQSLAQADIELKSLFTISELADSQR